MNVDVGCRIILTNFENFNPSNVFLYKSAWWVNCLLSSLAMAQITLHKIWEKRVFTDRILPYKDRIYDSVLIRENAGQCKPVFSHILCSDTLSHNSCISGYNIPLKMSSMKNDAILYRRNNGLVFLSYPMNFFKRLLKFLMINFSGNKYLFKNSLPYLDTRNKSQSFKKGCSRENTKLQNIWCLCRQRKVQIIQNNRVKRSRIYFISSNICLVIWDLKSFVFTKLFCRLKVTNIFLDEGTFNRIKLNVNEYFTDNVYSKYTTDR